MVKWGEQEVRTSAKRDSGKDCSWPKEELALIFRTKKQLQEPLAIEVGEAREHPPALVAQQTMGLLVHDRS